MIIWRGWGALGLVVYIVILLSVCGGFFPDIGAPIAAVGCWMAAPGVWWFGRRMNGKPVENGIVQIFDDAFLRIIGLGDIGAARSNRFQSLMFIRLEYWAVVVALLGDAVLLVRPFER